MKSSLVSVIIPTYNRSNYLKLTLDSVVNQTYPNIEIIVVDDGSPNEDSLKVCEKYKTVTYLKIENSGGPAKPRNVGIKASKGKYVAILDDDDLWFETKITQQVKILENHRDYGLVHGYCQIIDADGVITDEIIGKPGSPDVKHGDVSLKMIGNWTLMTSSVLFNKELIDLVGLFNEEMPPASEDVEFWVRCSFYTKIFDSREVLVKYRKHELNISKQKKVYIDLPLYLKQVLDTNLNKKIISNATYKILNSNICRMQIKMIKLNTFKTFSNLLNLDPMWFLNYDNLKLLIYKILVK